MIHAGGAPRGGVGRAEWLRLLSGSVTAKRGPERLRRRGVRCIAAAAISLLPLAVPLPSAAAQDAPPPSAPGGIGFEADRQQDAQRSSLPVLSTAFFSIVGFGHVRLVCPDAVVEGDLIRCFVAEYTLVGKRWLGFVRLWEQFRLPTPVVEASASSPSVPPEVLVARFESPGSAVSVGGSWWVSVQTVDDDRCDAQPYELALDVAAGTFSLDATVTVLDDGDPLMPGESGAQCVPPARLEVLDASASEGDGALVFAVRATESVPQSDVQVNYALTAGSAVAGGDYSDVSGTLTIPAGVGHATVSVPLIDDAVAESAETFGLVLSSPVGATLAKASATATITDDDVAATQVPPPPAVCDDVVLVGSVRDVFDVAQPGFAGDHHAFVDVDVTCPDAGSPAGIPVAVSVVGGPQASLGASTHCLAQVGARTVTASAAAAAGCGTFAVPRPVGEAAGGRSTHLVKVPDGSVGHAHQLLVWADADRDRTHDRGEPYQYVASDFVGRSVGGGTLVDYGLADDFDVELVTVGSDRIGRGGLESELRLRLHTTSRMARTHGEPVIATAPLANALVGVSVAAGPSTGADVMCLSTAGTASRCRTDADGQIIVRYRVGTSPVSVLRRSQDTLAVFHDPDQDGRRAFGSPTSFLTRPVAKAVNYVALGDSYTSGEQGRSQLDGFVGAYENDPGTADTHCRRWNLAYPYVFANDILRGADHNIDLQFQTFACTGAKTAYIYHPLDSDNDSIDPDLVQSRRPSKQAPAVGERGWEPRQSVSLANTQATGDVDMVTVTIGGNDAGFADVLKSCVSPSPGNLDLTCSEGELPSVDEFAAVGNSVETVLRHIKGVAPDASVFVLGYPYLTPCPPGVSGCDMPASRAEIDDCRALSAKDILAHTVDVDQDYSFLTIPFAPFIFVGDLATDVISMAGSAVFGDAARISLPEAQRLWLAADRLNDEIEDAASAAGVHFVSVAEESVGHSACAGADQAWMHGFVLDTSKALAYSDRSFHPTRLGHEAIADALGQYVARWTRAGFGISEAGIPVNPASEAAN